MQAQRPLYFASKRLFDFVFSMVALIILAPLFLVIALAIKLDSKGPAVFRQARISKGGKEFTCYKFRSMVYKADQSTYEQFLKEVMHSDSDSAKDQPFRLKDGRDDPRITRLGRWLRRWSLDELPQLFNVLRGEMSMVGPRPDVLLSVEGYTDFERQRLQVLPGITGLWQVSGRADTTVRQMFDLDAKYVAECSFWLDLKILLRTIPVVISKKGAG